MALRRSSTLTDDARSTRDTPALSYESIMNSTDGFDSNPILGRGAPALSARLSMFRTWLEEHRCVVHPAICIVNGEATDGTKNAPVLVFGPPPSVNAVGTSSSSTGLTTGGVAGTCATDKTHGRCGLIDTDMDRILYDRTMGCQVRTVKEMKKDEVMMTIPTSLFITPDLIASSDAGKAVLACCRPRELDGTTVDPQGFWDAFGNTTEREKKFLEKISQSTGTQLLVKILQERKRVESALTKAAKDLEDAEMASGEGHTLSVESLPEYKLIDRGTLSTRAPVLAFLIQQRFSNHWKPPVCSSHASPTDVEKIATKKDALDDTILPIHAPTNSPSTFAPYARTLPPAVPLPICWKRNELALLAGCIPGLSILQEIVAQTMVLSSDLISLIDAGLHYRFPSTFSKNMITWDRWLWAASVHASRILPSSCYYNNGVKNGRDHIPGKHDMFYSPPDIWDELGVMIPLLDMLNHETENSQVTLESPVGPTTLDSTAKSIEDVDVRQGMARVILNKRVKKGAEVYTNYGLEGNKELIIRYGFAQIANQLDSITVGWGLNDCVGGVPQPADYKALTDNTEHDVSSDSFEKLKQLFVFESSDTEAVNAWWSEARLSLLENEIRAYDSFWTALRSGKKMSPTAFYDGTYDPVLLTAVVVATLPRAYLYKYQSDFVSASSSKAVTITKMHQVIMRKYLAFFFSRKIERLLQSLSNGLKDHFNQVKLWTKVTEGGLFFSNSDENSSEDMTGCIGWQSFFDSVAYLTAVDVEKKYYTISPDSCVLTLYDGHLKSLQSSLDGILSESKFSSVVLKQLEDLGFIISNENDLEEDLFEERENADVNEDVVKASNTDIVDNEKADDDDGDDNISVQSGTEHAERSEEKSDNAPGSSSKMDNEKRDRTRNRRNRNKKSSGAPAMKLHLGNLAYQTTPSNLYEYFSSRYGRDNVLECHIPTERETGRSRGFGFVTMPEAVSLRVLQSDTPHEIDGRIIKIAESNTSGANRGVANSIPKGVAGSADRCVTCGYRPRYCTCPAPNVPGMQYQHFGSMMPPHGPMHMMQHDDMYGGMNPLMMGNYMPGMMGPYNPDVGYYGRGPNADYDRPGRHRSRSWNRDRSLSRSPSRHRGNGVRGDMLRDSRYYEGDNRERVLQRSYSRSRSRSYSRSRRTRDSERESSRRRGRHLRKSSGSRNNPKSSRYRSRSRSSGSDDRSASCSTDASGTRRNGERDRDRKSAIGANSQDVVNNPSISKGSERSRSRSHSMPPQARDHDNNDHEKKREGSKKSRANRSRSDSRERSSRKRKRSSKSSRRSKSKYRSPSSSSSDSSR